MALGISIFRAMLLNNPAIMVSKNLTKILWTVCLKFVLRFSKCSNVISRIGLQFCNTGVYGKRTKVQTRLSILKFDYTLYSVSGAGGGAGFF